MSSEDTLPSGLTDDATPPAAAEMPMPSRRAFPRWLKWLVGVGAVLAAIGLAGTLIRLPYATFSPGAALDLAPLVKVHGAPSYSDSGDVMLLFVRERDHVNVWSWLQAKLDPDIDIARQDLVNGGSSQEESNAAAILGHGAVAGRGQGGCPHRTRPPAEDRTRAPGHRGVAVEAGGQGAAPAAINCSRPTAGC